MRQLLEDLAEFVIAGSVSDEAISVGIASLTSFARNDTPPSTDRLPGAWEDFVDKTANFLKDLVKARF